MSKNITYLLLIFSLIIISLFTIKYFNFKNEINKLKNIIEFKDNNNQESFSEKIKTATKNSADLINTNISDYNIDIKSILLEQKFNLLFYFNDKTCGTCIDEALVDVNDYIKENVGEIQLLVSYEDERDYMFLDQKIDFKHPVIKVKDIPFLSPTFLIVDKKGGIINSHTYIKEFPEINKLFLMSTSKLLAI
ncbi:hypothetical protein [Algibacter pacificus]|uniref:hypothetical protein n=1 Tax=Algibacter pacificus TaxID=2599389 RepID=UPI0011CC20C5|nr:hypothetical protein [Algibacter pacificus]